MKVSLLHTKPIRKMPEVFFYNPPKTGRFNMMSMDSRMGFVGVMNISDTIFKGKETLKIIDLLVFDRRRGYGSKFIELAKNLSKKYYDGGVVLLASTLPIDPFFPPHVFYRKQGFTTDNKSVLKKIDKAINKNKQISWLDVPDTIMYFPEEKIPKKSCMDKIKNLFLNK